LIPRRQKRIQAAALGAFQAIGGRDYARVDVMVRGGEPVVLEVNTLPGMTEDEFAAQGGGGGGVELTRSFASAWWNWR